MVNGTLSGTKLSASNVNINRKIIMGQWNILLDQDSKVLHFTYKTVQQFQIVREDSITVTTPYAPTNDSMIFSTITSGIVAPGAPRNLAISSRSGNSIGISFDAPSYDGGASISDYKIVTTVGTQWSTSVTTADAAVATVNNGSTRTATISSLEPGNRYTFAVSAKNSSSAYGSATSISDSTLLYGCTSSTAINYNPDANNQGTNTTCIEPLTANSGLTSFSTLTIARGHLVSGGALQTLMPATYNADLAALNLTNANTSGQPQVAIKRGDTNTTVDIKSITTGSSGSAATSYVQFNLRDTGSTTTTLRLYITHPTTKNTYIWSFEDSLSGNGLSANAYQPNGSTNNWQWVGIIPGISDLKRYIVTASGGAFIIDGTTRKALTLTKGNTYTFDISSSTLGSHPLRFSTGANGGGTVITSPNFEIVGTRGTANSYIKLIVPNDTNTLYYYCANHSGMGAQITKV